MRANTLPALISTVGPNSRNKDHHLKLFKQSTISRVYTQFYFSQIVKNLNKLSEKTATTESVDIFKQRLDVEWSSRAELNWDATDNPTVPSH